MKAERASSVSSAGVWSALDLGTRSAVQFITSIVLARFLSPADFGIYAIMLIFTSVSLVLIDGGFSSAIIQKKDISREEQTAVFWYNTLASLVISLVIFLLAPLIARTFGYPVLRPILITIALLVPIMAIGTVPSAMLQKRLRFDLVARAGLLATITSGSVAIVAVMNGAGVWTFVLQTLAMALVNTVALWISAGWRPLLQPHFKSAKQLASFGSLVALSGLLEVAYAHGSSLVIGKLHGARDLGFYNRAQSLQVLPANILTAIVTRVALPVFSTKIHDHDALRRGARMAQGVVMLINLPLMLALAAMPDLIIKVLYGPKWLIAAPVLMILAIGGMLFPLHAINLQLMLAQGRSDLYFKVEVAKKVVGISFVAIGSIFGIVGLALGQTIFSFIAFFINAGVAGRMIGYGPVRQLRDLAGSFALAASMAILLMLTRPFLHFDDIINLMILTVLGGMFFYGMAIGLGVGMARDLVAMTPLKRIMSGTRQAADLTGS